jgi:prepilin-type N-terminal cleavage/methylation domain-containing protein
MNRHGITLIELLLALTLAGLLAGLAYPRIGAAMDRLAVERTAQDLVVAHLRARTLAMVRSRIALLYVTADSLYIATVEGSDTLLRWRGTGAAQQGVLLSGPARPIVFAPSGVTFGVSNGTYVFERGQAQRRVIVSRWGRVRLQ